MEKGRSRFPFFQDMQGRYGKQGENRAAFLILRGINFPSPWCRHVSPRTPRNHIAILPCCPPVGTSHPSPYFDFLMSTSRLRPVSGSLPVATAKACGIRVCQCQTPSPLMRNRDCVWSHHEADRKLFLDNTPNSEKMSSMPGCTKIFS
jgi:hypothetical protein